MGVVAPWCLGMGLIVSITADAGQNATVGGSFATIATLATLQPDDLIPTAGLSHPLGNFGLDGARAALPFRLDAGRTMKDDAATADEIQPRPALKTRAGDRPAIDRTHKGNPGLDLRPSFDGQLRQRNGLVAAQMLGPHDDATPAASFSLGDDGGPLDGATSFAPWGEGEDMQGADDARPGSAMRPAALKERLEQGATPKVSRAEALSSTTPAPADGTPVAAVFPQGLPRLGQPQTAQLPNATMVPRAEGRPVYAALLTGERGARERKCLAEAVYFEARSEPEDGQAAVAQVVLNRATSGLYPASICGVVYQNRTHYKACQFSFACEGKSLRVTEPEAWHNAQRIADAVVDGRTYLSDVGGATHYHANYVRPGWARRLVKMDVIGHHIFYKLRHGQT